jgi:hypothetical protein
LIKEQEELNLGRRRSNLRLLALVRREAGLIAENLVIVLQFYGGRWKNWGKTERPLDFLPTNPLILVVGARGFEPPTPWSRTRFLLNLVVSN